jgi:uncharacterized protein YndB with AHSA1/START domain
MTQVQQTIVRKQIVVDAPIERAFSVFTARFGEIKPPEHNMLGAPIVETTFEPHVGGHIYDRAEDGRECRWARVLVYEPPTRVVFSWDIGPTRTRVELEHRNIDRHGPGWEHIKAGVDGDDGWPRYLDRFAALISG